MGRLLWSYLDILRDDGSLLAEGLVWFKFSDSVGELEEA
jgi:hypothetical protein